MDLYVPADFFVLRTPLLPFEEIALLGSELASAGLTPTNCVARVRGRISRLLERSEVREAIFLASPSLEASLDVWLNDPDSPRGQKVERALVRYLLRAAGRATPFGLLAGCAIGIASRDGAVATQLSVPPVAQSRRHTQLSIDYLDRLCAAIANDEGSLLRLRPYLTFRPNQTIYRSAETLRLFASHRVAGERAYQVTDVNEDEPLQTVLRRAQQGALIKQLVTALLDRYDDTRPEEATAYLESLIDSQVLVPDFGPILTGPPPFGTLMAQLARYLSRAPASARTPGPVAGLSSTLESVLVKLRAIDAQELSASVSPSRYHQIVEELRSLPVPAPNARLFQVDLTKPAATPSIGPRVIAQVQAAIPLLHRVLPASPSATQIAIDHFARSFVERFGEEEIPLLEALDEEAGVPFDREALQPSADSSFGPREEFLLGRIEAAQRQGESEISLSAQDIDRLAALGAASTTPLPDALCVRFALAATSAEAVAKGDYQICVNSISGPSGVNLLGRFSHAEPALSEKIRAHLRAEERLRPDALFAEVVHLAAGHGGNILLRPLVREHEITLLGRSGAPPLAQITPDDLFVAVVREDDRARVLLRSHRLGREVIPRLTTAADPTVAHQTTVYRFLSALQGQGVATDVAWRWGALSRLGFLPRVTHGRLVLSRALWRLRHADLLPFANRDRQARAAHIDKLRQERAWPRFIAFADGQSELPIDLDNPLCIEALAQMLKGRSEATLIELFPSPDALCASGPDGHYVHEIILPFIRDAIVPPLPTLPPLAATVTRADRLVLPGASWLFGKLCTGSGIADRLLGETIAPLMAQLLRDGSIDHWFFTRSNTPDFHLGIYLHGPAEPLATAVNNWQEALAPRIIAGSVFSLSWLTYRRELDRYGGSVGAALAERIFQADSEAVIGLVSQLFEDEAGGRRFRLGLLGVDRLLDDLGLDLSAKTRLVRGARDDLRKRHRRDGRLFSLRYRAERSELEAILHPRAQPPIWLQEGLAILHERSTAIAPLCDELRALGRRAGLSRPLEALAMNFVQMYLNRLLRGDELAQTHQIYDFLSRLYERRLRLRA